MMFKNVLVPTDLTERTSRALDIAVGMLTPESGKITLLHVVETINDAEAGDFNDFYDKLGRRAGKLMDKIIAHYREAGHSVNKEIIYGKRVKEILGFAEEHGVDLIILSSHRIDRENIMQGWGTISHKVGILADCPTMLVK